MTEHITRYVVTGRIDGRRLWLSEHTYAEGNREFLVRDHSPNAALFTTKVDAEAALDRISHGTAKNLHIIPIVIQYP